MSCISGDAQLHKNILWKIMIIIDELSGLKPQLIVLRRSTSVLL